jgi:hypothetical protein
VSPLEGGSGVVLASAQEGGSLAEAGYEEVELMASGTATSYTSAGPLPTDGRFDLAPDEEQDYATRIIVRRPEDPAAFDGTVVVEWLNVSGGADAAPDYAYLAEEILREGAAWVGVSAQRIGVEGGPVAVSTERSRASGAGSGLKGIDPARYGALVHPGDAFAYDIYSQVGRAVRSTDPGAHWADAPSDRSWPSASRSPPSPSRPTSTGSSRSRASSTASSSTAAAVPQHP